MAEFCGNSAIGLKTRCWGRHASPIQPGRSAARAFMSRSEVVSSSKESAGIQPTGMPRFANPRFVHIHLLSASEHRQYPPRHHQSFKRVGASSTAAQSFSFLIFRVDAKGTPLTSIQVLPFCIARGTARHECFNWRLQALALVLWCSRFRLSRHSLCRQPS